MFGLSAILLNKLGTPLNWDFLYKIFLEVEAVEVRSGIMMEDVQRRLIRSRILFHVPNSLLTKKLSMKTSLLVVVIVLEDL